MARQLGSRSPQPIVSAFADDPEMESLLQYFLTELKDCIRIAESAIDNGDQRGLWLIAHHLKGAAGAYGYPQITDSAAELESTLDGPSPRSSDLSQRTDALLTLCRRAASVDSGAALSHPTKPTAGQP